LIRNDLHFALTTSKQMLKKIAQIPI